MSADLLDDLLSGFLAPAGDALSAGTPAKPANPANREDPCGAPADFDTCEGPRISANPEPVAAPPAADSQTFAALRNSRSGPESEQWRGLSQDSRDSQGGTGTKHSQRATLASNAPVMLARRREPEAVKPRGVVPAVLPLDAVRTCTDCGHLSRVNTCAVPVAAGLLTEAEGFGIAWPPANHAPTCPAFSSKAPRKAPERPYRLTLAQGEAAHAEAWDDAAIARFQARVHRLARLGVAGDDADDLAERLHLRDVEGDDCALCVECGHYRPGRCGSHSAAGLRSPELARDLATTMQCCGGFKPAAGFELI